MMLAPCLIILIFFSGGKTEDEVRFPDDLLIGFGTSSYQIEGAWNEDGKGENVWDRIIHTNPDFILNGDNADTAADSYHKWQEDIELLRDMGAQVYRFTFSWSRIQPNGDVATVNQLGIDYYNKIIDELLANGIQPLITIFCWDLPQPLQDLGGWPNPILADYFEDYAKLLFKTFGDRVKWWATFNEPFETCHDHYGNDVGAPAINMPGTSEYLCAHTILKAHARVYHAYNADFKPTQKGQMGIVLSGAWNEPPTDSQADKEACEVEMQFEIGWFLHPILKGDYPAVMRDKIDANSLNEGRPRSRLPAFTEEEIVFINGTIDFLGHNHYTTTYATPATNTTAPDPSWERDKMVDTYYDPSWPGSASEWLKVVPWGLRKYLNWFKDNFNNIPVFITENGFSDHGDLEDTERISYHQGYLNEMLKGIYEDGCNVIGYIAWSLLDNFEWRKGYSERFGIYHVDFNNSERPRTPKNSARFFKELLSSRTLPIFNSTLGK